jgi:ribosome biogenesis SPOUT family RNA methylase Rps3
MKNQIYIIEHLEPELFEWCVYEYENISSIVGKENLWLTNIKNKKDAEKLSKFGKTFIESVRDIKLNPSEICVLDPEASQTLNHEECSNFKYFVFGGILGDFPPKRRTKDELTKFIQNSAVRNIGKEQMSTDNAVLTVSMIANGRKLNELKFKDSISVKINEFENIELPYKYNVVGGKPFISEKIINYLRKKKSF